MKRKLFTLLAAISLLLCVATVGLWVRSYWRADLVTYYVYARRPSLCWHSYLGSESGFLRAGKVASVDPPFTIPLDWNRPGLNYFAEPARHYSLDDGVYFTHREQTSKSEISIKPSHWLLALVFAILPSLWFVRFWRVGKIPVGHCGSCGYDLRATPERCPECGLIPETERRRDVETK